MTHTVQSHSRRFFLPMLIVSLVVLSFPAQLMASDSELRDRILKILVTHDKAPSKRFWKRVGIAGQTVLINLGVDHSKPKLIRARALGCLVFYPNARSRQVLTAVMNNGNDKLLFRQVALRTLAATFRGATLGQLKRFIYHRRAGLRLAAAQGLRYLGVQLARRVLTTALINEKNLTVREAMVESLNKLKKR